MQEEEWKEEIENIQSKKQKEGDLRYMYMGPEGAQDVAALLRKNTYLQRLLVSSNELGDEGIALIAKALKRNTTLVYMDLSYNDISEPGARSLLDALQTNVTLHNLVLLGNTNIPDALMRQLAQQLETNKTRTPPPTPRRSSSSSGKKTSRRSTTQRGDDKKSSSSGDSAAAASSSSSSSSSGRQVKTERDKKRHTSRSSKKSSSSKSVASDEEDDEHSSSNNSSSSSQKPKTKQKKDLDESTGGGGGGDTKNAADPAYLKQLEAQLAESQRREAEYRERIESLEFRLEKLATDTEGTPREVSASEKKKQKKKKQFTIHFQNVRITEKLAATGGSSAGVFSCYVDGWLCAVKEFELDSRDSLVREQMGHFLQEIEVLEKLPPHNNIARYLYHEQTPTKIRLYLTKYATSLGERIRLRRENVEKGIGEYYSPQDLLVFSLDIVRGLEFLHKHKIIHRDLKTDNVFVLLNQRKEIQTLAIGDFDTAKKISKTVIAKTLIGTPAYMSPEVFSQDGSYSYACDIYSFGMTLFEMMTLQMPFFDVPHFKLPTHILSGKPPTIPDHFDDHYKPIIDLHRACIARDPAKRPTASEIKESLFSLM